MNWGELLFRTWAVVTAACLLLLIEPSAGPAFAAGAAIFTVVALGVALRWAIAGLMRGGSH
jgi:quinol-cytochrome oxidoreductase complex cytochrome b subunit